MDEDKYTAKNLIELRKKLANLRLEKGVTRQSIKLEMIYLRLVIEDIENG